MNLTYDLYGSSLDRDHRHAKKVMQDLGITYQHCVPQSLGDCWWFFNCTNVPEPLPKHFSVIKTDPQKLVGHGLSKQEADSISKAI